MKKCHRVKENLVAYLSEELTGEVRTFIESHLGDCSQCSRELGELRAVFEEADSLGLEFQEILDSVDWDLLPKRIAANVFDREASPVRHKEKQRFWNLLSQPKFRPVMAGVLAGVVLGSFVTFLFLRSPRGPEQMNLAMTPEFLDNVEMELARRQTIDYLDQSQSLLIDLAQASSTGALTEWRSGASAERAQELLSKKKYINPQLNRFRLAKAKAICDQIEFLFFELAQMRDEMTDEEFAQIQRMIENRQILLKIKIVREELKKSEV
ncbi:anti-sigma factor family protein [Acidobacteriota bacterium]